MNKYNLFLIITLFFSFSCNKSTFVNKKSVSDQKFILGTYAGVTRFENTRVNIPKLLDELIDLKVNTYNWLIWQGEKDWDDLQIFLPLAKKKNINVWVTLVPPSESKPRLKWSSEPYETDYLKWAQEIATLSKKWPNLVVLSIDDFGHNLKFYTQTYVEEMRQIMHHINPKLKFIPCLYYKNITPEFAADYEKFIDGVLFPYRADSEGGNLINSKLLSIEVNHIKNIFSKELPFFLDVYLTQHSRLGKATPEYARDVIKEGGKCNELSGILIYTHVDEANYPNKYDVIKSEFSVLQQEKRRQSKKPEKLLK